MCVCCYVKLYPLLAASIGWELWVSYLEPGLRGRQQVERLELMLIPSNISTLSICLGFVSSGSPLPRTDASSRGNFPQFVMDSWYFFPKRTQFHCLYDTRDWSVLVHETLTLTIRLIKTFSREFKIQSPDGIQFLNQSQKRKTKTSTQLFHQKTSIAISVGQLTTFAHTTHSPCG